MTWVSPSNLICLSLASIVVTHIGYSKKINNGKSIKADSNEDLTLVSYFD